MLSDEELEAREQETLAELWAQEEIEKVEAQRDEALALPRSAQARAELAMAYLLELSDAAEALPWGKDERHVGGLRFVGTGLFFTPEVTTLRECLDKLPQARVAGGGEENKEEKQCEDN